MDAATARQKLANNVGYSLRTLWHALDAVDRQPVVELLQGLGQRGRPQEHLGPVENVKRANQDTRGLVHLLASLAGRGDHKESAALPAEAPGHRRVRRRKNSRHIPAETSSLGRSDASTDTADSPFEPLYATYEFAGEYPKPARLRLSWGKIKTHTQELSDGISNLNRTLASMKAELHCQ